MAVLAEGPIERHHPGRHVPAGRFVVPGRRQLGSAALNFGAKVAALGGVRLDLVDVTYPAAGTHGAGVGVEAFDAATVRGGVQELRRGGRRCSLTPGAGSTPSPSGRASPRTDGGMERSAGERLRDPLAGTQAPQPPLTACAAPPAPRWPARHQRPAHDHSAILQDLPEALD